MRLRDNSFAYPVLTSNVSLDGDMEFQPGNSFEARVSDNIVGQGEHELKIQYFLKNEDLQNLINCGEAKVVAHLESGLTSFRKLIEFPRYKDILRYKIDSTVMTGTVDLTVMIVTNVDMDEYKNTAFNSDVYGSDYSVRNLKRGDILAFEPTIEIQISMEDDIEQGVQTYIKLAKSDKKVLDINLDNESIIINLPEEAYNIYAQLQNSKEVKLASTALLLPALMAAIDDIKDQESTNDEYLWNRELRSVIVEKLNYDETKLANTSSIIVAQQILNRPIIKAFESLMEVDE